VELTCGKSFLESKGAQKIQIAKFNPQLSKSILLLIHLSGFISNQNPYFWILSPIHLIGCGLDIKLDKFFNYPKFILGWILSWSGPKSS